MHDVEDTAELITRLNAKAIIEAYRAGKEAGMAECDRLQEAVKDVELITRGSNHCVLAKINALALNGLHGKPLHVQILE